MCFLLAVRCQRNTCASNAPPPKTNPPLTCPIQKEPVFRILSTLRSTGPVHPVLPCFHGFLLSAPDWRPESGPEDSPFAPVLSSSETREMQRSTHIKPKNALSECARNIHLGHAQYIQYICLIELE